MDSRITVLYETHKGLGARFVDFAGWRMPVLYSGVVEEHMAVREACGIFDVSHMGEIEVSGPGAEAAVQYIASNDIERIVDGQCQYTLVCNDTGGVIDDTIVYRRSADNFLFCTNAINTDSVFCWLLEKLHGREGVEVIDRSGEYAQIAIQGPASLDIFKIAFGIDTEEIRPFRFIETTVAGSLAIVSKTGYTGEQGLEIYLAPASAPAAWDALMAAGAGHGIKPIGLGARDTLRLEMGYPLYGYEITEEFGPIEAGLKRFVALEKGGFIGQKAMVERAEGAPKSVLVGLRMEGSGVPRTGYELFSGDKAAGNVTSGTHSPALKYGVAMAYVAPEFKEPGTRLNMQIRKRSVECTVVAIPFYRREKK
ncbi:MAG: glycine cleavage system aminomethyltransferase GcvT [Proteobacteria bacterium]|nr:glycine cleavage system aminomethyltransferase GcvT [Pseudomonadota bacterium]